MASVGRLVTDAAARLIFTSASVTSVEPHERFRTIGLAGAHLVGTDWVPGDKVRVHLDGLTLRTYTPMSWDRERGVTSLLAYVPGDGPGAAWCERVAVGDPVALLGPKRSVRLDRFTVPPIFIGDETSFGLLLAWRNLHVDRSPTAACFEVTSAVSAASVLRSHDAPPVDLVEREADDAHVARIARRLVDAVRGAPEAPVCLTGRAQTIAALRRRLKSDGLTGPDTAVKAYWDENRKGLD